MTQRSLSATASRQAQATRDGGRVLHARRPRYREVGRPVGGDDRATNQEWSVGWGDHANRPRNDCCRHGRSPQSEESTTRNAGLPDPAIYRAPEQRELDPAGNTRRHREPGRTPFGVQPERGSQWKREDVSQHERERDTDERESERRLRIAQCIQRRRVEPAERRGEQTNGGSAEDAPYPRGNTAIEFSALVDHAGHDVANGEKRHRRWNDPERDAPHPGIEPLPHGRRDIRLVAAQ